VTAENDSDDSSDSEDDQLKGKVTLKQLKTFNKPYLIQLATVGKTCVAFFTLLQDAFPQHANAMQHHVYLFGCLGEFMRDTMELTADDPLVEVYHSLIDNAFLYGKFMTYVGFLFSILPFPQSWLG
jgi:hypothetical protein